jgi:UDP-GlcNAc:undecaprenyl-phosphate GlcNAc-1-phosphate transferase
MSWSDPTLYGVLLALVAALVLTPLVRFLARRWGMVSRPRGDRWAKKPTALLGGVAIFAAFALAYLTLLPEVRHGWMVLGASAFLFALGLVDDIRTLKPYQKLVGQIMGAALVVLGGLSLPWTSSPLIDMALTFLWLIGITNAVNLLDNMDGLAAGVAAIAAAFLSATFFAGGQVAEGMLLAAFAAALVGFLVYNFNPASVFMGDCGSMFIGFFLASASLLSVSGGRARGLLPVLAVPVLLLFIPIFDTTLVTVLRKLAGRAVSQGGRDHTSHRLVALGLSERKAVGLLYLLATLAGLMSILVREVSVDIGLAAIVAFTILLTMLGIYLAGVKVYEDAAAPAGEQAPTGFLVDLSYKRRIFEVLLDVALIGLAYCAANLLVFGPLDEAGVLPLVLNTLPLLVGLKLATFLGLGVYRGLWRYVGLSDLVVFARAVAAASAVSVLVLLFLFRFDGLSRVVFVLDGMFLLLTMCGSRMAFRLLRRVLPGPARAGQRRALIYGAGDGGELLVRVLRDSPQLGCMPIGFADDDPKMKGKVIHGLRVFGGNGAFLSICREQQVQVVYLSGSYLSTGRVEEIRQACRAIGAELSRMRIVIEPLEASPESVG